MSLSTKVRPIKVAEPELYHGIPVLPLRAGDPIPTPRAPERYAVRVYPDLARHLLTLNHPENRGVKPRTVARYVRDMRLGLWRFTPESIVVSTTGVLQNGQHRLTAAAEYGAEVWMMLDLGWPDEIITAIDRGSSRTNSDALTIESIPHATIIAGAMAILARYEAAVGLTRGFPTTAAPSAQQSLLAYHEDPAGWVRAARVGRTVYGHLDRGLTPSTWVAAFRIVVDAYPDLAEPFFMAIADGTEPSGSATRQLGDWFRRRPAAATKTGDKREPLEIIVRAFNAWRVGKPFAFPKTPGFTLSRIR